MVMISSAPRRIIQNVDLFSDDYVPDQLHARDAQLRDLEKLLTPGRYRGSSPRNVWLYGRPGTGKTSGVLLSLSRLERSARLVSAYVNVWRHPTLHSVVDTVNRELRLLETERSDTRIRLENLQRALNGRPCAIVLDEIDLAPPQDRNRMIYTLLELPRMALICICNSRHPLVTLDPRAKSRLRPVLLDFPPYTKAELAEILSIRAGEGLTERSWTPSLLARIANLADGDARVAIQTLWKAAETADRMGAPEIASRHIEEGWQEARTLKHRYVLGGLSAHHQSIYHLVRSAGEISSTKLRLEYENRCKKEGKRPVAVRTFQLYLQTLVRLRLLRVERAHEYGSVFLYSLEV